MPSDTWTMLVEPEPGVSFIVKGNSGDQLKTKAQQHWAGEFVANRVRYTIYSNGAPWMVCERHRGGSWRARWAFAEVRARAVANTHPE